MKNVEPKIITKLLEQLFGKMKKSNYKYEYKVEGKIPKGEYVKPVRSVVIVKKKHVQELSELFDLYNIAYRVREIKLEDGDFEKRQFL
ncbi:MAG: hypothetical protein KKA79_03375 [Nanoarchaeota archaeon]|nr:hypothetical protein [Euryarchaeota archaeon]MBU4501605.1 hypothetical protein [Nanoarchaeota archaeon]